MLSRGSTKIAYEISLIKAASWTVYALNKIQQPRAQVIVHGTYMAHPIDIFNYKYVMHWVRLE
jgi:hypothetical protein